MVHFDLAATAAVRGEIVLLVVIIGGMNSHLVPNICGFVL